MKNKQIIVDGINISECEFCEWKGSNIPQCRIRSASFEPICEGYKCYYKQLQDEKQNSQEARDTAIKEFNRVEELKKQVEIFTRQLENANKEVIKEKEKNATQRQKNEKFKQTLAEIKEITKNMNKECFYNDFSCDDCDMINGCTYQGKLSVLQKIKECEVENAKN